MYFLWKPGHSLGHLAGRFAIDHPGKWIAVCMYQSIYNTLHGTVLITGPGQHKAYIVKKEGIPLYIKSKSPPHEGFYNKTFFADILGNQKLIRIFRPYLPVYFL